MYQIIANFLSFVFILTEIILFTLSTTLNHASFIIIFPILFLNFWKIVDQTLKFVLKNGCVLKIWYNIMF